MIHLQRDIALFAAARDLQQDTACQNAAFFIMSGVDLPVAMKSTGEERRRILLRIERLLERERLKGMRRHWSYDLNRHIALKRAFDRLRLTTIRSGHTEKTGTKTAPVGAATNVQARSYQRR